MCFLWSTEGILRKHQILQTYYTFADRIMFTHILLKKIQYRFSCYWIGYRSLPFLRSAALYVNTCICWMCNYCPSLPHILPRTILWFNSSSATKFQGVIGRFCSVQRTQWQLGQRDKLSSLSQSLGSQVRIPFQACVPVCVYSVFAFSCP
jgi:hypothetical protein